VTTAWQGPQARGSRGSGDSNSGPPLDGLPGGGCAGGLSCGSFAPVVTARARYSPYLPAWRVPTLYRRLRSPSGRGRLRRSGPPRPGTDRPAGHGKADAGIERNTRPSVGLVVSALGALRSGRLELHVASAPDPRWGAALPHQRRMTSAVKPQQEYVWTGATVVPLMSSSREVATASALTATAAIPTLPPEISFLEVWLVPS
jgi:hypothetical protein